MHRSAVRSNLNYNENIDYPVWRGGRAVECTGLENRQGLVALRGFESHPLRHRRSKFTGKIKNGINSFILQGVIL